MASQKQLYAALATVYDTCSLFNGTRLDIVEMGLVDDVVEEGDTVRVRLLLTDPMCLYLFEMRAQIISALEAIPGIESVEVEPVAGELWWPERMSPAARDRLARLRAARRERLEVSARTAGGPRSTDDDTPASRA
jgi:metal-sulfur cluster biosynthetic enzyme